METSLAHSHARTAVLTNRAQSSLCLACDQAVDDFVDDDLVDEGRREG